MFEDADDSLQLALSAVSDSDLKNLSERAAQVQNWLNPVVSYTVTCMDEMEDSAAKEQILGHGTNVTDIADNALAILGELPSVLAALNVNVNVTSFTTSRRLLEEEAASGDQYPSWFSAADRKLMARSTQRGGRAVGAAHIVPNAVVAQDGSGQFRTVAAALDAYPKGHKGRYIIYVKAGVYREYYVLTKEKVNVYLYGDGARRTIITNSKSVVKSGLKTSETASFGNNSLHKPSNSFLLFSFN